MRPVSTGFPDAEPVGAENQSEIGACNERRCPPAADERQRLPRYGDEVYGYGHIHKSLYAQHQRRTKHKVFGKEFFGFFGNKKGKVYVREEVENLLRLPF